VPEQYLKTSLTALHLLNEGGWLRAAGAMPLSAARMRLNRLYIANPRRAGVKPTPDKTNAQKGRGLSPPAAAKMRSGRCRNSFSPHRNSGAGKSADLPNGFGKSVVIGGKRWGFARAKGE